MRIGIARYPYFRQRLKGGDHVLFDAILAAIKEEHAVELIEYRRPLSRVLPLLPELVAKVWVRLVDLWLPFLFTRQLLRVADEYGLILADSAVITRLPCQDTSCSKIVALINIDYHAYFAAVGSHVPLRGRAVMRWKAWLQDRGLASFRSIAVSRFVAETTARRGLHVTSVVENHVHVPEQSVQPHATSGLVYAGSGDYWGKGLDKLSALAARGLPIHTYSPATILGGTNHGAVQRDVLLKALPAYQAMVFPSRYESFGLVVIEALAAGIPVIMGRTGVGVDLARTLPECVLAAEATIDDWEKAIETTLLDRNRIVNEGRKFASAYLDKSRFDANWRNAVRRLGESDSGRLFHKSYK